VFDKLNNFVEYVELYGLKDRLPESYIKAKHRLKEIAVQDNISLNNKKREIAFYDWLKICINPQKEASYDFYFEKNNINKEQEVKEILFDKNGNLREIFKNEDWQIRLRKISDWFLKRYEITTAKKILKSIKSSFLDKLKLYLPRLWGAIFIGFLPLIMGQETWDLPHKLHPVSVILLSLVFFAVAIIYLTNECYNIIRDKAESELRALKVGGRGALISVIASFFICLSIGEDSVHVDYSKIYLNLSAGMSIWKNILFFASSALLIGIFIQVFWEEKTITEPL
jgi:hypothetical protein